MVQTRSGKSLTPADAPSAADDGADAARIVALACNLLGWRARRAGGERARALRTGPTRKRGGRARSVDRVGDVRTRPISWVGRRESR